MMFFKIFYYINDNIVRDCYTDIFNDVNNKILGIIDYKSIFLINNDKINKDILEKFPVIEKITINKKLPQTLI